MLAEVLSSEYLTNRALQELGYSESRINLAIRALFGPDPDALGPDDFEEIADDLVPYVLTEADWLDYHQWAAEVDARWTAAQIADEEWAEAQALADIFDTIDHERRYTDRDLERAGLPVG